MEHIKVVHEVDKNKELERYHKKEKRRYVTLRLLKSIGAALLILAGSVGLMLLIIYDFLHPWVWLVMILVAVLVYLIDKIYHSEMR